MNVVKINKYKNMNENMNDNKKIVYVADEGFKNPEIKEFTIRASSKIEKKNR